MDSNTESKEEGEPVQEPPYVNLQPLLRALATVIYSKIEESVSVNASISQDSSLFILSEERFILQYPTAFDDRSRQHIRQMPTTDDI